MKLEFTETLEAGARVAAPPVAAAPADAPVSPPPLDFDMPRGLFLQLFGVAIGYLAVMGFAFRQGAGLGLIFAVFGVVAVAYYGLPFVMARASGAMADLQPPRGAWGIDTASGYLPGHAAWAQVMTVPVLMLAWAVFVAVIH